MPQLLLALYAPAPAKPPKALDTNGMRLRWEDPNGMVWDLTDKKSGVLLLKGTRGLDRPTGTRFRDSPASSHGSQHRGTRWAEREVFWPINTWHEERGESWMLRDREFFAGLDPDRPGRWVITHPNGGPERYLELRYDPDKSNDDGFDTMPSIRGWANYGIYLTADQPFWVGAPSTKSFDPPRPPDPFFEPNGPHLFNIGQGFTTANATIDNVGDVESYGTWYVDGETAPGAMVGVGSRTITIPFAVPAGFCLVIESEPSRIGAVLYEKTAAAPERPSNRVIGEHLISPVNRSKQLGASPDFAPVPVGRRVGLSVNFEGTGVVELSLPSLYKRAW